MARKVLGGEVVRSGTLRKPGQRDVGTRAKIRLKLSHTAKLARAKSHIPVLPVRNDETLAAALARLRSQDPDVIGRMLDACGPIPVRARSADLAGLLWIIVSQQVSTASANAIYARFAAGFPGFDAPALAQASDEALRACGLSSPKMRTIRAVAASVVNGGLDFEALTRMEAAEAHAALIALHGIGPWTADIFLLFCLGHPDAWPVGDLALQEAARMALNLRQRPDAKKLEKIGERWRPVRGVAARVLWAWYGVMKQAKK